MFRLDTLPAGPYALAISGHADSTALLRLMLDRRPDCPLHLVHLDHELRGEDSTADASFVADLARQFRVPLTSARLSQFQSGVTSLPANPSARYRAIRHMLFGQVVAAHGLSGVLLAHHADDQAETVLQRILRGSLAAGLGGMEFLTKIAGLRLYRPLLDVRKSEILDYLRQLGQTWREDASNTSADYQRNRIRQFLAANRQLVAPLLELRLAAESLRQWTRRQAIELPERFPTTLLAGLPAILAHESARRWLIRRGSPPEDLTPEVVARLILQAADGASPPRQHFPGRILVGRRHKCISALQPA